MDSKEESVVFELPFVEPDPVDLNGDGRGMIDPSCLAACFSTLST